MPIKNRFAEMLPEITAWRRDLHENPELMYDTHRTAATVAARRWTGWACKAGSTRSAASEARDTLGLLDAPVPIEPIPSAEYPTHARRPGFSVLDTSLTSTLLGEKPSHWRVALREMLRAMPPHA